MRFQVQGYVSKTRSQRANVPNYYAAKMMSLGPTHSDWSGPIVADLELFNNFGHEALYDEKNNHVKCAQICG